MPNKNFAVGSRIQEKKKRSPREGLIVSTDPSFKGERQKWLVLFDGKEEPVPRSSQQLLSSVPKKSSSPSNAAIIENEDSDEGSENHDEEEDDLALFPKKIVVLSQILTPTQIMRE